MGATETVHYSPTEFTAHHGPDTPQWSASLNSTIDTFCIWRGRPYKTLIRRSMAAGFCVYARLEKPVKEIEWHIFVKWVRGRQQGELGEGLSKAFTDQTLWRSFMASVNHHKCPQTRASGRHWVAGAQTHSTDVNYIHVANNLGKTLSFRLPQRIQTGNQSIHLKATARSAPKVHYFTRDLNVYQPLQKKTHHCNKQGMQSL